MSALEKYGVTFPQPPSVRPLKYEDDPNADFESLYEALEPRLFADGRKLARVRRRSDGASLIVNADAGYIREAVFDEIERTGKIPPGSHALPSRYCN